MDDQPSDTARHLDAVLPAEEAECDCHSIVRHDRRASLIATKQAGSGNAVYRLDIHIEGDKETVFFEV